MGGRDATGLPQPHREAVHRGLTWLSLPQNALLGTRLLYRTVDDISAVGDKSVDFSFYTKRGLLAGVIGSTMLCWLDDQSEDAAETKSFLRRRIADVMKIHACPQTYPKFTPACLAVGHSERHC